MLTAMCIEAANYIIKRTNEFNFKRNYSDKISMTCKRLQKLLYFSEVEYMKRHDGEPMFEDNFYAWQSGPVIPSVYDVFVQYQNGEMYPIEEGKHTPITTEMKEVLDYIFEQTIEIDTYDLVDASHIPDGPWYKVYDANREPIVTKSSMYDFYKDKKLFKN